MHPSSLFRILVSDAASAWHGLGFSADVGVALAEKVAGRSLDFLVHGLTHLAEVDELAGRCPVQMTSKRQQTVAGLAGRRVGKCGTATCGACDGRAGELCGFHQS